MKLRISDNHSFTVEFSAADAEEMFFNGVTAWRKFRANPKYNHWLKTGYLHVFSEVGAENGHDSWNKCKNPEGFIGASDMYPNYFGDYPVTDKTNWADAFLWAYAGNRMANNFYSQLYGLLNFVGSEVKKWSPLNF